MGPLLILIYITLIIFLDLPIVTKDSPSFRETVEHDRNGFLVSIKDPRALVIAIEQFNINQSLIHRMGEQSRKIAEEKYDVNKVNKVILEQIKVK